MKPAKPALSLPRLKKLAIALAGALVLAMLFLWLAVPRILQAQAQAFVAEKTGHRLEMSRPEFNPFDLTLRLAQLKLSEPDGKPLLAFDELRVDLSAASLARRSLVLDAVRLDGLAITLVERAGGGINWTPFLAALQSKDAPPASGGLPRLEIGSFVLAGGSLDFADQRTRPGFATRVEPLELSLSDISTRPDASGRFGFSARTSFGAQLRMQGELTLNPIGIAGDIALDDLQLGQLAPYLKDGLPAPPAGKLTATARYRAGNQGKGLDAIVTDLAIKVADLRVPLMAGDKPAVTVAEVELAGGSLALASRSLKLGKLALRGGRVAAVRDAQGRIDLLAAVQAIAAAHSASAGSTGVAWRYRLDKAELADWSVALRDESVAPAAELALEHVALGAEGVSEDLQRAVPVRMSFDVASGGRFEAAGKLVPADAAVDLQLKLADLSLKPAQPFLAQRTTLRLADGKFSTEGQLSYSAKGPDYRGQFELRGLRVTQDDGDPLLAWKTLAAQKLALTANQLDIGELRLGGLDTKLIIAKDKSVNLAHAIKPASVSPAPTSAGGTPPQPAFSVNIDRLRFYNGALFFADHSLVLPFATRIHGLRGSVVNLSSRPGGGHGQVELEGAVDDYGMARAAGQLDLFDPTGFMDLRVLFRNVEMTRLTPYTATFAGRKIDAGKLSLDLQYRIMQRQLHSENQVVIDRLTLGERVDSPGALDLPLDLAIAILQDADGRIDLGLPIAGSLDDPQFSYGQIVWQAIRNVIGKIVTAPFRALAALFGGSGEKVESIAFEAGAAQLTPPEREKLARLAAVLAKRPGLRLALGGTHAEADRVALQDAQLRRAVLTRLGERVNAKYDPGPLATSQPKVRAALEDLYGERFGASDLAALKEGFRRANPGQLEEGLAGRVMSRLSGLLREKKTLSAAEVEQLKGGDFPAILFERLRAREAVGDDQLQALARARADHAIETLRAAGVAVERLQQSAPEKGDAAPGGVPLKLALEANRTQ